MSSARLGLKAVLSGLLGNVLRTPWFVLLRPGGAPLAAVALVTAPIATGLVAQPHPPPPPAISFPLPFPPPVRCLTRLLGGAHDGAPRLRP